MAITYLPTSRTIAIDMSKLAGITTAGSFDPMNGSYGTRRRLAVCERRDRQFTPLVSRQQQRGRWRLGAAARGRGSAKVIISIRQISEFRASASHLSWSPLEIPPGRNAFDYLGEKTRRRAGQGCC